MKKILLTVAMVMLLTLSKDLSANNLQATNLSLTGQNSSEDYIMVEFDLSWKNSWRNSTNWDAAWVFVKYQETGSGEWKTATLSDTPSEHNKGSQGSGAVIKAASGGEGIFYFRSGNGTGDFSSTNVQLRWEYGDNNIGDVIKNDVMNVAVFAIEMCYVIGGSFYVGSGGTNYGELRAMSSNTPVQITSAPVKLKSNSTHGSDTQLQNGITIDGDGGIDWDNDGTIDNANFPTGFQSFYCMKYEITQEQYVDFLNTQSRTVQNDRTDTDVSGTSITNRYVMSNTSSMYSRNSIRCDATIDATLPITFYCDYNGNDIPNESGDGQNIACNYLSWSDGCSYAVWSGLRPMSELEYEKACRGLATPVTNEYAWGTASIANSDNDSSKRYSLSNSGSGDEEISSNYSTSAGNCSYDNTDGSINGPLRVGIFASNISNTGRVSSGATYYGIMEMSGNLWERCISIGSSKGREYKTSDLNYTFLGSGFRGGSWSNLNSGCRVSYRYNAAYTDAHRYFDCGFRCVRSGVDF